jgi:hypothetical protein
MLNTFASTGRKKLSTRSNPMSKQDDSDDRAEDDDDAEEDVADDEDGSGDGVEGGEAEDDDVNRKASSALSQNVSSSSVHLACASCEILCVCEYMQSVTRVA